MITSKTILINELKKLRCDALCCPEIDCGCGIDDLMPCDGLSEKCVPAIKTFCNDCGLVSDCIYRAETECDWCFCKVNPEAQKDCNDE